MRRKRRVKFNLFTNQSHRRQDVALTIVSMLKWKKRSGRYGYKHMAETDRHEIEIEKKPSDEPLKKKHWYLSIIRKGVLGANRVALCERKMTVKLAKDRAVQFLKNEGANKI